MELMFRVKTYDYLFDLLYYFADLGCRWVDGESLYDVQCIREAWDDCGETELWVILDDDDKGVSYRTEDRNILYSDYKVFDCDSIEELKCVIKALKRLYVKQILQKFDLDKDDYDVF